MGRTTTILTFKENENKKKISAICTEWGDMNIDPGEHGGQLDCGGINPNFKNIIFDTYDEAAAYLEEHSFGNYRQLAVKYKAPAKPYTCSKTAENLYEKFKKYSTEHYELMRKFHYKDIKSKTIRCKHCGAVLPTEYHGRTYANTCPVCSHDLRPQTVIDKINKLEEKKQKAFEAFKEREKMEQLKMKQEIFWAVACEVHC